MLFYATPQLSSHEGDGEYSVQSLRKVLMAQQEDVTELCTIVEYLRGLLDVGLDESGTLKYSDKIAAFSKRQGNRFNQIDSMINHNRIQLKKGKTTDNSIFTYGKEVRKLEAGLRTLHLFCCDIIEMLKPNSTVINRSEERIRYFDTRSAALEIEMSILGKQIAIL